MDPTADIKQALIESGEEWSPIWQNVLDKSPSYLCAGSTHSSHVDYAFKQRLLNLFKSTTNPENVSLRDEGAAKTGSPYALILMYSEQNLHP